MGNSRIVVRSDYQTKTLPVREVGGDVLEAAEARIRHCYAIADEVVCSFSGGKDSTVLLNLHLKVARDLGRLPVRTVFWDEEAIHPPTIDYVERVARMPEVALEWYCVPVKHVNACSPQSMFWYPWAPEDKELWCRPLPELPCVRTTLRGLPKTVRGRFRDTFIREPIPNLVPCYCDLTKTTAVLLGVRADESLRRRMSVCRRVADNWISDWRAPKTADHLTLHFPNVFMAKPIYDWGTDDIWLAPARFGWDYNRTYDYLEAAGVSRVDQRVTPPFGEQPMQNLWWYQVCFPELWDKLSRRVPGAATAARYARSVLYSFKDMELPPGRTWKEMIALYLQRHAPAARREIAKRIEDEVSAHVNYTDGDPVPDEEKHPVSGISWRWLAAIACRGDLKKRKKAQTAAKEEMVEYLRQKRLASGMTPAEVEDSLKGGG